MLNHGVLIRMHYGYNYLHLGMSYYTPQYWHVWPSANGSVVSPPARDGDVGRPAETMLVSDAIRTQEGAYYYAGSSVICYANTGFPCARHNESGGRGTANILWCDGHVAGYTLTRDIFDAASYVPDLGACDGAGGNYGYWDR